MKPSGRSWGSEILAPTSSGLASMGDQAVFIAKAVTQSCMHTLVAVQGMRCIRSRRAFSSRRLLSRSWWTSKLQTKL